MGYWVYNEFYFGKAAVLDDDYTESQMEILQSLRFDDRGLPIILDKIETYGPALYVQNMSKYGEGYMIPDDIMLRLYQDIVINFTRYSSSSRLVIWVNDVCVFNEERELEDETPWTQYVGGTEYEQNFFMVFWEYYKAHQYADKYAEEARQKALREWDIKCNQICIDEMIRLLLAGKGLV